MNYIFSATLYLFLFYSIGIIYTYLTKSKVTFENILLKSAYGLSATVTGLFFFNFLLPLKYILNPYLYIPICVISIFLTVKLRPKVTVYSLLSIISYYVLVIYIFQIDLIYHTKVSFGWNEDFFFHERIMRIINQYSQLYNGPYPAGYIDTVGRMLNRIHYPIGSHIMSLLFNNFDSLFHSIIAAASNSKIFFAYSYLVFVLLNKSTKKNILFICVIGLGIYLFPLMQSMVANDFIGQFPSFFMIALLIGKFLKQEFDFEFMVVVVALLITYYFMLLPFAPALLILSIYLILKRRFKFLEVLAVMTLFMFLYYLPLAKHIEGDTIPGGITQRFSWKEVLGIGFIYSGIQSVNRFRYIFIPLTLSLISFMFINYLFHLRKVLKFIRQLNVNLYGATFVPVAVLTIFSYYVLKPYLFYKLLPPLFIMVGFFLVYGFNYLSRPVKVLFIFSWISLLVLNAYHSRLYYYNPTRTSNSQFPSTQRFKTIDSLMTDQSVIITDNIYFNNLLSLKHKDLGIYTHSAYSNFISGILVNNVNQDSRYYLPDYPADKINKVFMASEIYPASPPLSVFLFRHDQKDGIDIDTKKETNFVTIYEDNKPRLIKNMDELKYLLPLHENKSTVFVWQNVQKITHSMVPNQEIQKYFVSEFPIFLYSAYEGDNISGAISEINIDPNDYLSMMKNILSGDYNGTTYVVDVGLYIDNFFVSNLQPIRFWESKYGWSKLITTSSTVNIPFIFHRPKQLIFTLGSSSIPQEITLDEKSCTHKVSKVSLKSGEFKDIVIDLPQNCITETYLIKIEGNDLGRDSAILDKFKVVFDSNL